MLLSLSFLAELSVSLLLANVVLVPTQVLSDVAGRFTILFIGVLLIN